MSEEFKISKEDYDTLQEYKNIVKESDHIKLEQLAMKSGWNVDVGNQKMSVAMMNHEAEQARLNGMSIEQYRHAIMMEEQARAQQNGGYPQPNFMHGAPQAQQVPPNLPLGHQGQQANQQPPWGAPQAPPARGPDPTLRKAVSYTHLTLPTTPYV